MVPYVFGCDAAGAYAGFRLIFTLVAQQFQPHGLEEWHRFRQFNGGRFADALTVRKPKKI